MTFRYAGYTETFDGPRGHQYHFLTVPCPKCGKQDTLSVDGPDLFRYNQGAFVQDAFPYLSAADRERLNTGICGPCWDAMFAEPEDED